MIFQKYWPLYYRQPMRLTALPRGRRQTMAQQQRAARKVRNVKRHKRAVRAS